MINTSRCREKIEGWRGRRRNYKCRNCGQKFQVDALNPLPENDRICSTCRKLTGETYRFKSLSGGNRVIVKAHNAEMATLRVFAQYGTGYTFAGTEG